MRTNIMLAMMVLSGWFSGSLSAADNLYLSDKVVKEGLQEAIKYTQKHIDICIRNFAAMDLEEILLSARQRGVRVRSVIIRPDMLHKNNKDGSLVKFLVGNRFDIRVLSPDTCSDRVEDFILLDDRILVTGVYNWLAYRNRNYCNNIIFYYNQDSINKYKSIFYRLFTEGRPVLIPDSHEELIVNKDTEKTADGLYCTDTQEELQETLPTQETFGDEVLVSNAEQEGRASGNAGAKEFIDISFEELNRKFGKGSSLSWFEKRELWKKYEGKYVHWYGNVSYKGMSRVDWNRVGVNIQGGDGADVEILFDWQMFDEIMSLRIGDKIEYTGRLISRPGISSPFRLEDGYIVE